LTDWSAPFDPAGVPEANFEVPLEQLNLRGAGLRLIRRSMDAVEFQPLPGRGNRLTMRKKR
jgi:anti-sigma regulatory factor (Ser/Thr protein kinase)